MTDHDFHLPEHMTHQFRELAAHGRIIGVLSWAHMTADQYPGFRPWLSRIENLCKTMDLRELNRLAESLDRPMQPGR
jgi:hypothetical protein